TVSGVNFIGGLVGGNTGSIANAYSSARVMGTDKVGGLAGSNTGTIQQTYAMGHVTGTTNTGGLVGDGDSSKVTSSFWNEKMTGQETSAGGTAGKVIRVTEEVDAKGYAVLNAEDLADPNADMMSSSTFSGWDFGSTWVMDEGGSFPHFQYRYPEGVRGVWGVVYDDGGVLPVAVDENIALYVNTNPLDLTGLGTQVDMTKSMADGIYYFVMGKNDVQATDWVIGKVESYSGLEGNTRVPAETGSIMGLDIWGHRERTLSHAYKEPPPIPMVIVPQQAQIDTDRSLTDVMDSIGRSEITPSVWNSPSDVEIQDETFSAPEMEWLDEQVQGETFTLPGTEGPAEQKKEADLPAQSSLSVEETDLPEITFYEDSEPGREPIATYSVISVASGARLLQPRNVKATTLLSIAAEAMQSSGEGVVPQVEDGKFASLASILGGNDRR
ncbi:MAG: hypothetical protein PHV97_00210, partial [Candidatus Omnitrophica bacterium]|nr:hypothetical protein [Candidatus Omnitrophota bacterium]